MKRLATVGSNFLKQLGGYLTKVSNLTVGLLPSLAAARKVVDSLNIKARFDFVLKKLSTKKIIIIKRKERKTKHLVIPVGKVRHIETGI